MKKGFTLAEIMVALTVIGILGGILVPVAMKSKPKEDVLKFKKAHETLTNTIGQLVRSDKYLAGDLGVRADGNIIYGGFIEEPEQCPGIVADNSDSNIKYFCNSFADLISTKSVNCSNIKTGGNSYDTFIPLKSKNHEESWRLSLSDAKAKLDEICKQNAKAVGSEIITTDNTTFYQTNPQGTFGILWGPESCNRLFSLAPDGTFLAMYKPFCIDIDGIPSEGSASCDDVSDICPFGYGIRVDGKILSGARADEWLEKSAE